MANYLTLAIDMTLPQYHAFMTNPDSGENGLYYKMMSEAMEVELDMTLNRLNVDMLQLFKMIAVR